MRSRRGHRGGEEDGGVSGAGGCVDSGRRGGVMANVRSVDFESSERQMTVAMGEVVACFGRVAPGLSEREVAILLDVAAGVEVAGNVVDDAGVIIESILDDLATFEIEPKLRLERAYSIAVQAVRLMVFCDGPFLDNLPDTLEQLLYSVAFQKATDCTTGNHWSRVDEFKANLRELRLARDVFDAVLVNIDRCVAAGVGGELFCHFDDFAGWCRKVVLGEIDLTELWQVGPYREGQIINHCSAYLKHRGGLKEHG